MNGKTLAAEFRLNMAVIDINLDGISHRESIRMPMPGGNCLNWVVGHLVASRNGILRLLGEDPVWSEEKGRVYERGAQPPSDPGGYLPLKNLIADLKAAQEKILPKLEELDLEEGAGPRTDGSTIEKLLFLHFHETYHIGQLGLMRRLVGKPGAIS